MNILISTSSFGKVATAPLDRLQEHGFNVTLNPHGRKLTQEESIELLPEMDGLIAGTESLNASVLAIAPRLRVISRVGTGMDNVDQRAASERRIEVFNTPIAHVDAVAELTLAGILSALRALPLTDRKLRDGQWHRPMGRLLKGKVVGLVGLGRVAQRLVELLAPFGVKIISHDPAPNHEFAAANNIRFCEFDELLGQADVISLHCPGSPDGKPIISRQALDNFKPDALLVNCARGNLIDEAALAEHLRNSAGAAAYLDTFQEEPYQGELTSLDNVILSPHIGGYAAEARLAMETQAVDNLLSVLARG